MQLNNTLKSNQRIVSLINEVKNDEHMMDILVNSYPSFENELQAMYFSNMRRNMVSDMAWRVIQRGQSPDELSIMKKIRGTEKL